MARGYAEILNLSDWVFPLASRLVSLSLNLPELEVSGLALVTAIDDCAPIAGGEGS
ncbi:MAG: hypothetical protein ACKN85_04915 [Pirellula sp.]